MNPSTFGPTSRASDASSGTLRALRADQRGAVMLTGLFMSCFLIGSLWFIVGIGDAIVFRDKMQEAADHGAFSSAALQAKGMNFISLCNLVLLAAVTIHILLGLIHDISLIACILSLGASCGVWVNARKVYTGYFKLLKPAAKAIHSAQVAAAKGYPFLGLATALKVGSSYGGGAGTSAVQVFALGGAVVPTGGGKIGLPVEARPMSYLCKKIVSVGFQQLFQTALGMSDATYGGQAMGWIKSIAGGTIAGRYCNPGGGLNAIAEWALGKTIKLGEKAAAGQAKPGDRPQAGSGANAKDGAAGNAGGAIDPGFDSFWGEDGPMVVVDKAENGTSAFQVRAINAMPSMTDVSESRVGIARGPKKGFQKYDKKVSTFGYVAQAELYFDCESEWASSGCNNEDNATFQIKWRARLRQLSLGGGGGGGGAGLAAPRMRAPLVDPMAGAGIARRSEVEAALPAATSSLREALASAGSGGGAQTFH